MQIINLWLYLNIWLLFGKKLVLDIKIWERDKTRWLHIFLPAKRAYFITLFLKAKSNHFLLVYEGPVEGEMVSK